MPDYFRAVVPASSANLGPGFDAIGMALDLHVAATVQPARAFAISFPGGGHRPTNPGFESEIVRGMRQVLGTGAAPEVAIAVENEIPLGKGLGASAAGAVLGLMIGAELAPKRPTLDELARLACAIEGHPDNALPALLGGIVIAAQSDATPPQYVRTLPPAQLSVVVATPQIVLPTAAARALLPASYARADVVYNIQRAALLAASLAVGDMHALREATGDRVHQPYRAPLVPGFSSMLEFSMPGLLAVALSGAGPSVLAFATHNHDMIGRAMRDAFAREDIACDVRHLAITPIGARIERGTARAATAQGAAKGEKKTPRAAAKHR